MRRIIRFRLILPNTLCMGHENRTVIGLQDCEDVIYRTPWLYFLHKVTKHQDAGIQSIDPRIIGNPYRTGLIFKRCLVIVRKTDGFFYDRIVDGKICVAKTLYPYSVL